MQFYITGKTTVIVGFDADGNQIALEAGKVYDEKTLSESEVKRLIKAEAVAEYLGVSTVSIPNVGNSPNFSEIIGEDGKSVPVVSDVQNADRTKGKR